VTRDSRLFLLEIRLNLQSGSSTFVIDHSSSGGGEGFLVLGVCSSSTDDSHQALLPPEPIELLDFVTVAFFLALLAGRSIFSSPV